MVQSIQCLLQKHKDPRLIPRTHIKCCMWCCMPVVPVLRRWRQESLLRFAGQMVRGTGEVYVPEDENNQDQDRADEIAQQVQVFPCLSYSSSAVIEH